jgi:hypothetical protein
LLGAWPPTGNPFSTRFGATDMPRKDDSFIERFIQHDRRRLVAARDREET